MCKIEITCPNNNNAERQYIIQIIFKDFLGLEYSLSFEEYTDTYKIEYNNKIIEFEDSFFLKHKKNLSYLSADNLPSEVKYTDNHLLPKPLPIIFGNDRFITKSNHIKCGLDIFASSFFMLTRWEEFVIKKRNKLGKVDEFELWAVKNDLYKRPIVNEYSDFLKKLLEKIDVNFSKKHHFTPLITHDVDWCHLSTTKKLVSNIYKMIFRQKLYKKSLLILTRYLTYTLSRKNPFDSFNELMNKSEEYGIKNHFYFKATASDDLGHTYNIDDNRVKKIINNIIFRNHTIGFHPSENTIDNYKKFKEELNRLKNVSKCKISGGRNHGLFYNKNTFSYWEKENLIYDSGLGFQFMNGFRCGCCYEFNVFDIYKRETLNLKEVPFIAMDTVSIRTKQKPSDFFNDIVDLINITKTYNGIICLNWHSNLLNATERKQYKQIYFDIIDYIAKL